MIKKYAVLLCLVSSVLFILIAAFFYPGGSISDPASIGFGWSKNYLSNLFNPVALNGLENHGRIWAVIGMAFHSLGYGLFFINISKKIASGRWSVLLKYIGFANMVFIFLIATPLHDLGTFSIVLTLVGLFFISFFIMLTKLHFFKFYSIICLLTYYVFFFFYGFGFTDLSVLFQKIYIVCSILLVLLLEYFTKPEDFNQVKQRVNRKQPTI